jgi:hypothetical protein
MSNIAIASHFLRQRETLDNCTKEHDQLRSLGQKMIDDLIYRVEANQSQESDSIRASWEYLNSFRDMAVMFDEAAFITSKDFVTNCKIAWGIASGKVYEQLLEKKDPAAVLQTLSLDLDNLRREAVPEFENRARELVSALAQRVGMEKTMATLTNQISTAILHSRENPKQIIEKMEEVINLLLSMPEQLAVSKPAVSIIPEKEAACVLNDMQTNQYVVLKQSIAQGRLAMHSTEPYVYKLCGDNPEWNKSLRKVFEVIAEEFRQAGYQVSFNPTVEEPNEMVIICPGQNGKTSLEHSVILELRQKNEDLILENLSIKKKFEDISKEKAALESKISKFESTMTDNNHSRRKIAIVDSSGAGEKLTVKQQSEFESFCRQINQFIDVNWSRGQEWLSMDLKVALPYLEVMKIFILVKEQFHDAKWEVELHANDPYYIVDICKLGYKPRATTTRRKRR